MAIYLATTKSISRSDGRSAVASAAYRAGEKLQDARYGKVQNYSRRHGVMSTGIILPNALKGKVTIDRNRGQHRIRAIMYAKEFYRVIYHYKFV